METDGVIFRFSIFIFIFLYHLYYFTVRNSYKNLDVKVNFTTFFTFLIGYVNFAVCSFKNTVLPVMYHLF